MCETATSSRELIGLSVVNEVGSTVFKVSLFPLLILLKSAIFAGQQTALFGSGSKALAA